MILFPFSEKKKKKTRRREMSRIVTNQAITTTDELELPCL